MKLIIILCLIGLSVCLPQQYRDDKNRDSKYRDNKFTDPSDKYRDEKYRRKEPIKILRSEFTPINGANFRYFYETENGIEVEKEGTEGSKGQSNMAGFFKFPLGDGTFAEVRYIADENGYQPESSLLPTPHPMPAHALEQIRIAEEQRARGIRWDQRGFQI